MRLIASVLLCAMGVWGAPGRVTVSLNGEWRMADSVGALDVPAAYGRVAPVPGLANLAMPAFVDVDKFDGREFL